MKTKKYGPYEKVQEDGRVRVRLNKDTILLVKVEMLAKFESEQAYIDDYLIQYNKGLYGK